MEQDQELDAESLRERIVSVVTKVIERPSEVYVREKVDGVWMSVALSELAPARRAESAARWVMEGRS